MLIPRTLKIYNSEFRIRHPAVGFRFGSQLSYISGDCSALLLLGLPFLAQRGLCDKGKFNEKTRI